MKNKFTHLMIHCSATPEAKWFDRSDIEKWHLQERGWSRVGYSALFLFGTWPIFRVAITRPIILPSQEK